jgi:hypothetical protein
MRVGDFMNINNRRESAIVYDLMGTIGGWWRTGGVLWRVRRHKRAGRRGGRCRRRERTWRTISRCRRRGGLGEQPGPGSGASGEGGAWVNQIAIEGREEVCVLLGAVVDN